MWKMVDVCAVHKTNLLLKLLSFSGSNICLVLIVKSETKPGLLNSNHFLNEKNNNLIK